MNKGDLINKVAEVLDSKKDAQKAVDCVVKAVTDALAGNESQKRQKSPDRKRDQHPREKCPQIRPRKSIERGCKVTPCFVSPHSGSILKQQKKTPILPEWALCLDGCPAWMGVMPGWALYLDGCHACQV